jgi:hypothetical protein
MRARPVQIAHLVARGAYTGKRADGLQDTPWTLSELLALGLEEFKWDGT